MDTLCMCLIWLCSRFLSLWPLSQLLLGFARPVPVSCHCVLRIIFNKLSLLYDGGIHHPYRRIRTIVAHKGAHTHIHTHTQHTQRTRAHLAAPRRLIRVMCVSHLLLSRPLGATTAWPHSAVSMSRAAPSYSVEISTKFGFLPRRASVLHECCFNSFTG